MSPAITRTTYGLSDAAVANYAHSRAVEEAVVLAALSGNTYPSDENFMKMVSVQLIERTTSFAIHARRAAELTSAKGIKVSESRWRLPAGPSLETNFWTIVNKILHARDLHVATFNHGSDLFTNLGDRIIGYMEIRSDRGDRIHFSPYGLVYGYLSQISSLGNLRGRARSTAI